MEKSKQRFPIRRNLFYLTILILSFFGSCKKIDAPSSQQDLLNPQIENFVKISADAPSHLKLIIANFKVQLYQNNFVGEFVNLNGQPLWNKFIEVKKDENNFTLYIPTKKQGIKRIETFFIANYSNGNVVYEMHQRNSLGTTLSEPTYLKYTQRKVAGLLCYFDKNILELTDTVDLDNKILIGENAESLTGNSQNSSSFLSNASNTPPENDLYQICFPVTIEVPCEGNLNANPPEVNVTPGHCYGTITQCVTYDDGGGGGGGGGGTGGGGGGTGGGGGGGGGGGSCPWWIPACLPPAPVVPDPCAFAEQLKNDANFVQKFNDLTSNAVLNQNYEVGYMVNNRTANNYTSLQGNANAKNIYWNIAPGTKVDGMLHSHYGGLDNVFSPDDLIAMAQIFIKGQANDTNHLFMGLTSGVAAGSTQQDFPYLLTVGNVAKFRAFAISIVGADGNDTTKMKKFKKHYDPIFTKTTNVNTYLEDHLIAFMKLIKAEAGNGGLVLFQANDNQCNSWKRLMLNNAGHAVEDECPTI